VAGVGARGDGLSMLRSEYEPGQRVQHPSQPDWGIGQVQSVVGERVTVNFENAGKVLINVAAVPLAIVEEDDA